MKTLKNALEPLPCCCLPWPDILSIVVTRERISAAGIFFRQGNCLFQGTVFEKFEPLIFQGGK